MEILIKAAQLVLALVILVTIHEFGHYIFARIFGVKVNRFYLFFNPWFSLVRYNPMKGTVSCLPATRPTALPRPLPRCAWAANAHRAPTASPHGATPSTASAGCRWADTATSPA